MHGLPRDTTLKHNVSSAVPPLKMTSRKNRRRLDTTGGNPFQAEASARMPPGSGQNFGHGEPLASLDYKTFAVAPNWRIAEIKKMPCTENIKYP